MVECLHDVPRGAQYLGSCRGESDTAAEALEHRDTQTLFELQNAATQGRLLDPKRLGRLPEAPMVRSGDCKSQMPQFYLRFQQPALLLRFRRPPSRSGSNSTARKATNDRQTIDYSIALRYRYSIMKWIETVLSITKTDATRWHAPSRMLIGFMLVIPFGGISEFLSVCNCGSACQPLGPVCAGIRLFEIVLGGSLTGGLFVRVGGWLVVVDFGVRALAGFAGSFAAGRGIIFGLIEPYGDWVWGAVYLGAITLLFDIISVGGGTFSADRLIHQWLSAYVIKRAP